MNPTWLNHLTSAGAVIDAGSVAHFGDPGTELRASPLLMDLSHLSLLAVSGDDAETFLQGQFTNDVRQATLAQGQYSAHCTPKGRMLASFFIWKEEDGYRLQLPASMMEGFAKRLSMYVLRAKVKVSDISENTVRVGVAGHGASEALGRQVPTLPSADREVTRHEGMSIIRLGAERFEVVAAPERAVALWQALAGECTPAGPSRWDWFDIRAGIPAIRPPTREEFVPQMVNFEALGGVSFKKGCYTGQEIVARAQHIGQVKRRMYLAHVEAEMPPQAGDSLHYAGEGEAAQGKVVNAEAAPEGGFDLLAVIPVVAAEGDIRLWGESGPRLELLPLPYSLEQA